MSETALPNAADRPDPLASGTARPLRPAIAGLLSQLKRRIRSYVLSEPDGRVGTVCIYEASSPEAIRDHASRAQLAADEIIRVADTVVVRPDPGGAAAS